MIEVILVIVIAGVLLWAINTLIPMPEPWKKVLNVVAALFLIIYLLQVFGIIRGDRFRVHSRASAPISLAA